MNSIIIKKTTRWGFDSQMFQAYTATGKSLKVSASTTGNQIYGVMRCAVKAFIKFEEPKAEVAEIETRIGIKQIRKDHPEMWEATLQPRN